MTRRAEKSPARGITILGLGNWGSSLAHALVAGRAPLREVIVGPNSAAARTARGLPLTTLEEARLDAAVLWLCVPDSSIAEVARSLVERAQQLSGDRAALRGRIVVHSSGALAARILAPAARGGASIASVHPVMTFPTRTPVPLAGVFFGVEADPAARRKLYALIRRIGGRPFAVASSGKALYHAVGMFSSPLLVSLIAAAEETAVLASLAPRQSRRLIESIATATLKNIFSRGSRSSLSGPIARGDAEAVRLHLQALAAYPMLRNLYRSLALYALKALPARNPDELRRTLQDLKSKTRAGHRGSASSGSVRMRD